MFIPFEEVKMENTFGKEYLEYKRRVRRWLQTQTCMKVFVGVSGHDLANEE